MELKYEWGECYEMDMEMDTLVRCFQRNENHN